jgi:hypothetical protein
MSKLKLILGLFLSVLFLYLAIRKVDYLQMGQALEGGRYWYLIPSTLILFLGHFFRAVRWRLFLSPIQIADTRSLFSALIIGYMANVVTPAHLGEFLRAYVLSRKKKLSMESVFGTIVVERIVDVFSLLLLMLAVFWLYPFPKWVVTSGVVMLTAALILSLLLLLSKKFDAHIETILCRFMPGVLGEKLSCSLKHFLSGIIPLEKNNYLPVSILSIAIWVCYALSYYYALYIFDLNYQFELPWFASLVILVITTISIVVPSSPGYVGAFHFLCQTALLMFGVPAGVALSYATVAHGINILPVLGLGLVFSTMEGIRFSAHVKDHLYAAKAP